MYRIGETGGLYLSFPPNMQNPETEALCYAVERQIRRMKKLACKLNVWGDLDNADPRHYDYVASCLRALYYRSDMTNDQKLLIIKKSMMTYRYAGSIRAIEELLGNLFHEARFIPWYEYGGRPYHFKINVSGNPNAETKRALEDILKKVKAARSVIDAVEIKERTVTGNCYVGLGIFTTKTVSIQSMDWGNSND